MPFRHEGKEDGSGPLKGEFGMTYLLKPARQILSFYDNHFMTKCVYLQRKNSKQI